MRQILSHRFSLRYSYLVFLAWCSISLAGCQQNAPQKTSNTASPVPALTKDEEQGIMVQPGTQAQAFKYYKETFDELGLNPNNLADSTLVDSQNLKRALEFLGYDSLKPADLEDLPSAGLLK